MPRYRRKVTEIEAHQYQHGKPCPGVWGLPELGMCPCYEIGGNHDLPHVWTAHKQLVHLKGGEYIVPEPDGRGYYPILPDVFDATYELIEEERAICHCGKYVDEHTQADNHSAVAMEGPEVYDPRLVLQRVMSAIHSLPCAAEDFLGKELYYCVQITLYGFAEDEDDEEDEEIDNDVGMGGEV